MRQESPIVWSAIVALSIIFVVCVILAILAATAPYEGVCAGPFCLSPDQTKWFLGAAALVALVGLLFRARHNGTAIEGVGLVFMGLAVAAVLSPPITIGGAGDPSASADGASMSLEQRLLRTINRNLLTISLGEDLAYPGGDDRARIELVNGGLAVVKFTLPRDARIRIDVTRERRPNGEEGQLGDPAIELYQLGETIDDRHFVDENDDGGSEERAARIERSLAAGDYLLIVKNITSGGILTTDFAFELAIAEANLDDVIGTNQRIDLVRGDLIDCLNSRACARVEGRVATGGGFDDRDHYLLSLSSGAGPSCLIVDMRPKTHGDTVIALFTEDRDLVEFNDDFEDGSRMVLKIETADGARRLLLAGAYESGVAYDLFAALTPTRQDGTCPSAASVVIPEKAQPDIAEPDSANAAVDTPGN